MWGKIVVVENVKLEIGVVSIAIKVACVEPDSHEMAGAKEALW